MTDNELYILALKYGRQALSWRQKFIGLLPEIHRRFLWRKRGFSSVFEFAKKVAGLSEAQVRLTLNLEKRFEDKPHLKSLLVKGEVSINKLARVVSIATSENEEELAEKIQVLPKSAVETLVRDEKAIVAPKLLPGQTLNLSESVQKKLLELQEKGLDVNEILMQLLEQREQEIQQEKEAIAAELPQTKSRHIPAQVRRVLEKEHGKQCSVPTCYREAEHLHHSNLFSLSQKHDPRYIAPLCRDHHSIAHSVNLSVHYAHAHPKEKI